MKRDTLERRACRVCNTVFVLVPAALVVVDENGKPVAGVRPDGVKHFDTFKHEMRCAAKRGRKIAHVVKGTR